jgi:hypothetical protein
MTEQRQLIDEQIAYYRARAPEYDDWWLRRGRYDRGDAHRQAWTAEIARLEAMLDEVRTPRTGCAGGWRRCSAARLMDTREHVSRKQNVDAARLIRTPPRSG